MAARRQRAGRAGGLVVGPAQRERHGGAPGDGGGRTVGEEADGTATVGGTDRGREAHVLAQCGRVGRRGERHRGRRQRRARGLLVGEDVAAGDGGGPLGVLQRYVDRPRHEARGGGHDHLGRRHVGQRGGGDVAELSTGHSAQVGAGYGHLGAAGDGTAGRVNRRDHRRARGARFGGVGELVVRRGGASPSGGRHGHVDGRRARRRHRGDGIRRQDDHAGRLGAAKVDGRRPGESGAVDLHLGPARRRAGARADAGHRRRRRRATSAGQREVQPHRRRRQREGRGRDRRLGWLTGRIAAGRGRLHLVIARYCVPVELAVAPGRLGVHRGVDGAVAGGHRIVWAP